MSVITPSELLNLVPSLSLSPIQAESLIATAQGIAESYYGSNRVLEISKYTEVRDLNETGEFRLANFPLIVSPELPLTIEIKNNVFSGYGGIFPLDTQSRVLDDSEYHIDFDIPEINILNICNYSFQNNYSFYGIGSKFSRNRPLHRPSRPKITVRYFAGFDFSSENPTQEIKKLKSAIAAMVEILASKPAKGVKSLTSDQDKIEYFSVNEQQDVKYLDYLSIFTKYRPRILI